MKYIGNSTPAYSIVGEKNHEVTKFNVPGPGTNDVIQGLKAVKQAPPEWVFGTGDRGDWALGNQNPGPGSYFSNKNQKEGNKSRQNFKEQVSTFTSGQRNQTVGGNPSFPGPGSYQHKKEPTKEPPKFSFGYKYDSMAEADNALGPGQYTPSYRVKEFSIKSRFPKESRNKAYNQKSSAPGPGKYFPGEIDTRSSTKGTFSTARRDGLYKNSALEVPGPEKYQFDNHTIKEGIDRNKGFSISGKYGNLGNMNQNNAPGPGEYNPSQVKTKKKAPQYKFGTGIRPDLNPDYTGAPAPNIYF